MFRMFKNIFGTIFGSGNGLVTTPLPPQGGEVGDRIGGDSLMGMKRQILPKISVFEVQRSRSKVSPRLLPQSFETKLGVVKIISGVS